MKVVVASHADDTITETSRLIECGTAPSSAEAGNETVMAPSTSSQVNGVTEGDTAAATSPDTGECAGGHNAEDISESGTTTALSDAPADEEEVKDGDGDKSDVDVKPVETKVDMETSNVGIEEDTVSRVSSLQGDMCRICHCIAEDHETLISPCDCCGSMKWVHQKCLQRWVKSRDAKKCELCGFAFDMTSSVKPFRKWKKLNMSSVERRRVLCSVTFHVVAITCVIWSLYVLIDRTTQEIQQGNLNWPFWTKLVVVAIGFTGGLVFMYVQCKTYVKLFRRWKQFNRVIYINDIQLPDEGVDVTDPTTLDSQQHNGGDGVVTICITDSRSERPTGCM